MKSALPIACVLAFLFLAPALAAEPHPLADKRVVFLGDSITQAGVYVTFVDYYLEKLYPQQDFDIIGLGLSSETLSGLSEENHAGGKFPRPCLFERLGRLLDKAKPDVVFACYGINDGIYQPLDSERFAAFQGGVKKLITQCQAAGVQQIYLVTPPIYDATTQPGEFNYDSVMTEYAAWEMALQAPGVQIIDLHSAMRKARDAQTEVFAKDHVHPGPAGHLLMAKTILSGLNVPLPEQSLPEIQADPLYKQVDQLRKHRSTNWMKHIGYTREKTVPPQPLGETEQAAAQMKATINDVRRAAKN
ncbi:SGNH/GDSL hydrolase family protein [Blastopirellula sp. J2-11]|uniref:SGNH/GDSL hydrolase family protein n=1 Tax=Blastopirellula sp. J2-11 TaxID=2943192 RepID=UPI0021C57EBD|nr:SGNH/GDSL hydrolase family protein [Blastopirellula sp. J2-11]UUO04857.1 SGNH/GDSL hydrolase family protein [Blastopirellula sp. J2-11]